MADKIFLWEKYATKPEDEKEDKIIFNEVEEDQSIREVIKVLENKIIGNKRIFSDINPSNPSVKKWIRELFDNYPNKEESRVEDLLNEFRCNLYSKSREREKFIVAVLQLNDVLIIAHCKKDPSLAEIKDKVYSVKTILHPKNIIRADIITKDDGKFTLSAFEYSKKWSKGHASFWGIEPEDIGWESLGNITLQIDIVGFAYPIQIPIDSDQLKEMINKKEISPTGRITIKREEGIISKVLVYGKVMGYPEFYDFFVTETEKLDLYKQAFRNIVTPQAQLKSWLAKNTKHLYEEDENKLYEITTDGSKVIIEKNHPRFTVCYFTEAQPGIFPKESFLWRLYEAIFNNRKLEVWHSGEESTLEPFEIGSMLVYNQLGIKEDLLKASQTLLNQLQDAESRKSKLLLQGAYCKLFIKNLKVKHFGYLFHLLNEQYILKELEFEFNKNQGLFEGEDFIEFKSADDVSSKPTIFAKEELTPTIKSYLKDGKLTRYAILYGIEDNSTMKPLHHLKSDQLNTIQEVANNELKDTKMTVSVKPIPYKEGIIMCIMITPTF